MTTMGLKTAGSKLSGLSLPARNFLFALLAGLALIAAVNGLFLRYGQPVPDNQNIHASKRTLADGDMQRRLGWHTAVTVTDIEPRVVTVLLLDRDGAPLKTGAVIGRLRGGQLQGSGVMADRTLSFTPAGPSLWRAPLGSLGLGNWNLQIEVVRPDGPAYRAEWRLPLRNGAEP